MLDKGVTADEGACDACMSAVLFVNLQARSFASVERFLVEVINQRASRGQTPLMLACANG